MKKIVNWTQQVKIKLMQQDKFLLQLYDKVDCFQKWKYIVKNFQKRGFYKNQVQCRERFVNKLNPQLRKDKLSASELKLLFQYYDEYGPLWSIFETLIPGRNQNLLKNKFYSTLRTLIRIFISHSQKNHEQQLNISSNSLSSKLLVEIYQGKKNFTKFKGIFKSILHQIDFELDEKKINFIDQQIITEIVQKIKREVSKDQGKEIEPGEDQRPRQTKKISNLSKSSTNTDKTDTHPMQVEKLIQKQITTSLIPIQTTSIFQHTPTNLYFISPNNYTLFIPIWNTP